MLVACFIGRILRLYLNLSLFIGEEGIQSMLILRKMCFSKEEMGKMLSELDSYIWVALDVKKGVIAAGDEYAGRLKQKLLAQKSLIKDIFGVGLDLLTGEIDYYSPINIKIFDKKSTKEVPQEKRERIETLIKYFFLELPVLKRERLRPKYTKKI